VDAYVAYAVSVVEQLISERNAAHEFPHAEAARREATLYWVRAQRDCEHMVRDARQQCQQMTADARDQRERLLSDGARSRAEAQRLLAGVQRQAAGLEADAAARYPGDEDAQAASVERDAAALIANVALLLDGLRQRHPRAAARALGYDPPGVQAAPSVPDPGRTDGQPA